jgi:hypothetical protein
MFKASTDFVQIIVIEPLGVLVRFRLFKQPSLSAFIFDFMNRFCYLELLTCWYLCRNLDLNFHIGMVHGHSFRCVTLMWHFDKSSNATDFMFNTVAGRIGQWPLNHTMSPHAFGASSVIASCRNVRTICGRLRWSSCIIWSVVFCLYFILRFCLIHPLCLLFLVFFLDYSFLFLADFPYFEK